MGKNSIVIAVIALILGAGGGYALASVQSSSMQDDVATPNHVMPDGSIMQGSMSGMQGEMDGMMQALDGKRGDEFDKAFVSEMIMHHQGAIQMAELALKNAKRPEIKQLSEEIIRAQNAEITQMLGWQQAWFGSAPANGAAQSGMGM